MGSTLKATRLIYGWIGVLNDIITFVEKKILYHGHHRFTLSFMVDYTEV